MKPLSGVDALFLHLETPETPMHVGSLHVFELPDDYRGDFHANVKRHIAQRLHLAPVFLRKLRTLPLRFANPVWMQADGIDLDYHVRRATLPRPGTQAQLEACAAQIHSTLLDRSRPLWEVHVIDGLSGRQAGMYVRFHHAMLDGAAGIALARTMLDRTPTPPKIARASLDRAPGSPPRTAALASAALRHDIAQYAKLVRGLPDLFSFLAGDAERPRAAASRRSLAFGPRTPLNVSISGKRSIAAFSLSLDEVKGVAQACDAKLNDVVLAICSGALRRYLARKGGIPEKPLIAGMPFSLRESGNMDYSTQATMTLVNLATDVADPLQRLRAIRDAARVVKSGARRAKSLFPIDTPSLGAPWVLGALATLYGRSRVADVVTPIMNVVISNVPGPTHPMYLAGARMATCWPLSIVEHGMALNITVVSYCGALDFGLVAAQRAIPDVHTLARALEDAHAELLRATGQTRKRVASRGERAVEHHRSGRTRH